MILRQKGSLSFNTTTYFLIVLFCNAGFLVNQINCLYLVEQEWVSPGIWQFLIVQVLQVLVSQTSNHYTILEYLRCPWYVGVFLLILLFQISLRFTFKISRATSSYCLAIKWPTISVSLYVVPIVLVLFFNPRRQASLYFGFHYS